VISHYSDYLRYDLAPAEVVYQLALWGFGGIRNNSAISESRNFTLLKAAEYKTLIYQCEDVSSSSIIEETAQLLSDYHD
jgi:hypothetical protein